eukprot:12940908-Alexandrium_andersonii.AAC.1
MWQELFMPPFLEYMPPTPPSTDSEEMALIYQAARTYSVPAGHIVPHVVLHLPDCGLAREYL